MKPIINKESEIKQTVIDHDSAIFCKHGPKDLSISDNGALVGKRLAVKDLFALKGEKNSAGNPDWSAQASEASSNAFAVERLLQQGCRFVGFTHTDEIAYSLEGNNIHFGAAENPKLKGHACGGSSMGSAAAVAAGLADIGLGTDTGGSIRVPASYCGLFGFRPSHGAVNSEGLIPLAPAFDTTGWFTQSAELLEKVGEQLLPQKESNPFSDLSEQELVVCDELFDLVQPELASALKLELTRITPLFKKVTQFKLQDKSILTKLADTFRILQGREISRTHGLWVKKEKPSFAPAVAQRFNMAMALTEQEEQQAKEIQLQWQSIVKQNLSNTSVLFLPTTPTIAPKLGADTSSIRMNILTLTAIAGLTGSAQVHLPLINIKHLETIAPYGFSLLMLKNNDLSLLKLTNKLAKQLNVKEARS